MRLRIDTDKVGSFTPEKQKVDGELLENRVVTEDVEEIFEANLGLSNDDKAIAAMEFHDSQTHWNNSLGKNVIRI